MKKLWVILAISSVCFGLYSILFNFVTTGMNNGRGLSILQIKPEYLLTLKRQDQKHVPNKSTSHGNIAQFLVHGASKTDIHQDPKNSSTIEQADKSPGTSSRKYNITFYITPWHVWNRVKDKSFSVFENCKFKNCEVIQDSGDFTQSDVVIFKGRKLPKEHPFQRPPEQVWIFYEEEIPLSYDRFGAQWRSDVWKRAFNYTMTYDRQNTDFFFPYGSILRKRYRDVQKRDYLTLARLKTKDALIITSHCKTRSKRMEYIDELKKYINVDVLGTCGKPFRCGQQYNHNKCFDILNTSYRFYLAFENAFCRGYRTEKFYDNYNYDIIMVARGDQAQFVEQDRNFKNTYIATSDFRNVSALGEYLKYLSENPAVYAEYLQRKAQYDSRFDVPYRQAMCKVCERLNNKTLYHKQIDNLETWALANHICHEPQDL